MRLHRTDGYNVAHGETFPLGVRLLVLVQVQLLVLVLVLVLVLP